MPKTIAYLDVDYGRASGVRGNRPTVTRRAEAWAVQRLGIVWASQDEETTAVLSEEIIDGPAPVDAALRCLQRADLVVGHGLLSSDYRAMAMVASLSGWLFERTVDTLAILHEARGGKMPKGLGLSALARHNLKDPRRKPAGSIGEPAVGHAGHPPTEDAHVVRKLHQTMLSTGAVGWGKGTAPEAVVSLSDDTMRLLRGERPWINAAEWKRRLYADGRILLPTDRDPDAATLAKLSEPTITSPLGLLTEIAEALNDAEFLDRWPLQTEELLNGLQYLPPGSNITLRKRIAKSRTQAPSKILDDYAWALWRCTHREQVNVWVKSIIAWNADDRSSPQRQAIIDAETQMRDQVVAARRRVCKPAGGPLTSR